ncbi:MAG: hypothetical protein EKK46_04600 [Rhodocyclaceae bacterium]|nr:MAG: hypothetical protein EKK46_04600 [Rhodocyclaceae bacterium]
MNLDISRVVRLLAQGLAVALIAALMLSVYDRQILRPALASAQRVGVVDVAEVYRAKEAQFTLILTTAHSNEERQQAMTMAKAFAQRLPVALEELPKECGCLVLVKTAVAGAMPTTALDLTVALRRKVDTP